MGKKLKKYQSGSNPFVPNFLLPQDFKLNNLGLKNVPESMYGLYQHPNQPVRVPLPPMQKSLTTKGITTPILAIGDESKKVKMINPDIKTTSFEDKSVLEIPFNIIPNFFSMGINTFSNLKNRQNDRINDINNGLNKPSVTPLNKTDLYGQLPMAQLGMIHQELYNHLLKPKNQISSTDNTSVKNVQLQIPSTDNTYTKKPLVNTASKEEMVLPKNTTVTDLKPVDVDDIKEGFFNLTLGVEGGLTPENSIQAKKEKQLTNYGIQESTWNRLAKELFGIQPNSENFKKMTEDQARKVMEYYWTQANHKLPNVHDSIKALEFQAEWGGRDARIYKIARQELGLNPNKATTRLGSDKELVKLAEENPQAVYQAMLKGLKHHYDFLVTNFPKKYGSYKKGWNNRMKQLEDFLTPTILQSYKMGGIYNISDEEINKLLAMGFDIDIEE